MMIFKRFFIYSLAFIISFIVNNLAIAYDISNEHATVRTLFETNDISHDPENNFSLIPTNINSALATFNRATYFVWVDSNRHPQLTKITSNSVTTQRLDSDDNYQVKADSHHTFSLGIDKDGFIHVMGDMHNFNPAISGENSPAYLSRFTNANAMYWISNAAEDISSFIFQGDNVNRSVPGFGFSYTRFYNDRDMGLYMIARTNLKSGYFVGVRAVGLYFYDVDSKRWIARGGIAPTSGFTPEYKSILWEDNGNNGTPYQGFMTTLDFDMNNRMHFAATINNDPNVVNSSHIVYAYSDDGGITFHRADNTAIASLPMRVDEGDNQVDIVDIVGNGENYWNFAGVYTDGKNIPSITSSRWLLNSSTGSYAPQQAKINTWNPDTQKWSDAYESPVAASNTIVQHLVDHSGLITYFSDKQWGQATRSIDLSTGQKNYVFGSTLSNIDRLALRIEGVYRMVSFDSNASKLSVIEIKFANNGSFTREVWKDIAGGSLKALANSPNFPHSPDLSEEVTGNLDIKSSDSADNFGSRLRGFIEAPEDGDYTFYISGDNHSEFWLSSDTSVENASMLAQVKWWTPPYNWFDYSYQESSSITLKRGKRYYFEVMHKEGGGSESVAVAWRRPSDNEIKVIEAKYLSPWFAISEGTFKGKEIDFENNIALSGIAILGANPKDDGTLGYPIEHAGFTSNLNDGDLSTSVDNWVNKKNESAWYYDYAGVIWPSSVDTVSSVRLHHATFADGGWFDYPGLKTTLADTDSISISPRVQYTKDGGTTWQEVTNIALDYSKQINEETVPTVASFQQKPVTIQFDNLKDINGIRVFGDGAGNNNTAGFIGIYEFEVFKEKGNDLP